MEYCQPHYGFELCYDEFWVVQIHRGRNPISFQTCVFLMSSPKSTPSHISLTNRCDMTYKKNRWTRPTYFKKNTPLAHTFILGITCIHVVLLKLKSCEIRYSIWYTKSISNEWTRHNSFHSKFNHEDLDPTFQVICHGYHLWQARCLIRGY